MLWNVGVTFLMQKCLKEIAQINPGGLSRNRKMRKPPPALLTRTPAVEQAGQAVPAPGAAVAVGSVGLPTPHPAGRPGPQRLENDRPP